MAADLIDAADPVLTSDLPCSVYDVVVLFHSSILSLKLGFEKIKWRLDADNNCTSHRAHKSDVQQRQLASWGLSAHGTEEIHRSTISHEENSINEAQSKKRG